jgi:beta-galactosidase GanA
MQELIDWLKSEHKLNSLMETPKGVEVTRLKSENVELIFIINHNFVPTTVFLDDNYKDVIQLCTMKGEISIEPQHSLILEKCES